MCAVSMIGDHFHQQVPQQFPELYRWLQPITPVGPSREEFEALRAKVEEMHALLRRAKRYDEEHGEPDCSIEQKVFLLRSVAKLVGIDLSDVFPPTPAGDEAS